MTPVGSEAPAAGVPKPAANEDDERLRPGRIAVRGEQLRRLDEVLQQVVAYLAGVPVSVPREKLLLEAQLMRKVMSIYADRAKASFAAYKITESA